MSQTPAPAPRPEPGTPGVSVRGLSAWYGARQVLTEVDLEVGRNTVLAIMGSAGAGKSTLLRVLNRLAELEPGFRVEGQVLIGEVDTSSLDPTELRRRVGMVFERPTAFPRSVIDNVAFGLGLAGVTGGERATRVEAALRRVDLLEELPDLSVRADALAAGQRQRLCIARALALQPEVLLLDEPTRWLHPAEAAHVEAVIGRLRERLTVIVSVADASQAGRFADQVALVDEGRLVEAGPTESVFTNPQHPETQAWLSRRFR